VISDSQNNYQNSELCIDPLEVW